MCIGPPRPFEVPVALPSISAHISCSGTPFAIVADAAVRRGHVVGGLDGRADGGRDERVTPDRVVHEERLRAADERLRLVVEGPDPDAVSKMRSSTSRSSVWSVPVVRGLVISSLGPLPGAMLGGLFLECDQRNHHRRLVGASGRDARYDRRTVRSGARSPEVGGLVDREHAALAASPTRPGGSTCSWGRGIRSVLDAEDVGQIPVDDAAVADGRGLLTRWPLMICSIAVTTPARNRRGRRPCSGARRPGGCRQPWWPSAFICSTGIYSEASRSYSAIPSASTTSTPWRSATAEAVCWARRSGLA